MKVLLVLAALLTPAFGGHWENACGGTKVGTGAMSNGQSLCVCTITTHGECGNCSDFCGLCGSHEAVPVLSNTGSCQNNASRCKCRKCDTPNCVNEFSGKEGYTSVGVNPECEAGTWSATGKKPCAAKTVAADCTVGQTFTAGTDTVLDSDDSACNACAAGSFNTAAGGGACSAHKTAADCAAGTKFDATNASATMDATCDACVGGFSAAGATDCTAHNACTEKGVKTAGTAIADAECNACTDLSKKNDCKGALNSDGNMVCEWDKMLKMCFNGPTIVIEDLDLLERLMALETKVADEVAGLKTADAGLQTQIDADGVAGVNRGTEVTTNTAAIAAIVADYVTSKEVTDTVKGKSYLAYCETAKRKNQNTASRRGCGCACDFLTGDMNCPAGICTVDPSKKKYARLKMTPKETSVCFLTSTRADNPHSSHDAECLIEAMADGWYLQATSYDNDDYTACEARCMEFS